MPAVESHPRFPFDLVPLLPDGVAASLSLAETGAILRLLAHSWRQQPPCSLPDDTAVLAAVVGIKAEQWPRLSRLDAAFTIGTDGRLHLREARAVYDRLSAEAERSARTSVVRANAARARWSQVPPDANAHANAMHMHTRSDANASSAPSERSALQRSSPETNSKRPLSALSADVIARIGSAGARALTEEKIHAWRRSQALSQLRSFVESLRSGGLSNVPLSKADELAGGPWSSPERVDAAICRVKDRMAVKDCHKPVGYLIAMLGLSAKGRASLVEVPLVIAAKWEQQEAAVARQLAVVAATAAAIEERRFQVSQSQSGAGFPRAHSGAG